MENKGRIVIISGFSGAGKGTLMKALMKEYKDKYALSVSATTRAPRPGEKDGVDYFFVTKEQFESMKDIHVLEDMVTIRSTMKAADIENLEKLAAQLTA